MNDPQKPAAHQRTLGTLAQYVLDCDDLDKILNESCRLLSEAFGTGLAKVMEIEPSGDRALVRGGVGWRSGIVGVVRVDLGERSTEAHAINRREPLVTADLRRNAGWELPEFVEASGVTTQIDVPIMLPGQKVYGVLQLASREVCHFGDDDVLFLKTCALMLGSVIDRLQKLADLQHTAQRYRLIVENARDYAIVLTDREDRVTHWMRGAERIFGWREEEILGKPAAILFTPEDRVADVPRREVLAAVRNGQAPDVRWHQHKDGRRVFIDGQITTIRGADGELAGFMKIGQDVTRRKGAEMALRRSEARLAADLGAMQELQRVSTALIGEHELSLQYAHIVEAAARLMRANVATMQEFQPASGTFRLLASRGLTAELQRFWATAKPEEDKPARPGFGGERVIIETSEGLQGDAEELELYRLSNIQAFQSTPLRAHSGRVVGRLATFWEHPHSPTESELRFFDVLARVAADLIERIHARDKLRASEEQLRQFGEASSDVLWIREAKALQWQYLSPAFERIYGIGVQEALAGENLSNWANLIVPEDRQAALANIKRVRGGEVVTFEYRVRRPDGQIRWLRDNDFPMRGAGGEVERIGGVGQDVTEMKRNQERLAQSEERLRSAVQVGRLALWDWRIASGEVHWSDEHYRMLGYAVGEVAPSYEAWISRVHPEDRRAAEAALARAREMHTEYSHEFRSLHPDGSLHWLSGRGSFFYDESGKATRMVGAMGETTERREWEEQQKVLVGELQHRTRNLLAVVRAMADMTARSSTDLTEFCDSFRDRLDMLARVQSLLSRLTEQDRVSVDELVHAEVAAMNGRAERVTTQGPRGIKLRSATVQTLAMALHELATNAVKYGALAQASGRVTITWKLEPVNLGTRPWLTLVWQESGVTLPAPSDLPLGGGQGRELIERALPYQLGAKTALVFAPGGVRCTISLPISNSPMNVEPDERG